VAILYNNVRYKSKKNETEQWRELFWEVLGSAACERLIKQAHEDAVAAAALKQAIELTR
jgi:hypothetical protein